MTTTHVYDWQEDDEYGFVTERSKRAAAEVELEAVEGKAFERNAIRMLLRSALDFGLLTEGPLGWRLSDRAEREIAELHMPSKAQPTISFGYRCTGCGEERATTVTPLGRLCRDCYAGREQ